MTPTPPTTLPDLDIWLQRLYYISQIVLMLIAAIAALAAFSQARAFKLFEILKYIEAPDFRRARRIVIRKLEPQRHLPWWEGEDADSWEEAASTVCAAYDVIGRLMEYDGIRGRFPRRGLWSFFREHWAASIVRTHDALAGFLEHRRCVAPTAYQGFTWLADAARPHAQFLRGPTPD
jgi:hypothetical protein